MSHGALPGPHGFTRDSPKTKLGEKSGKILYIRSTESQFHSHESGKRSTESQGGKGRPQKETRNLTKAKLPNMARTSVRTTTFNYAGRGYKSRRLAAAARAVSRARQVLRGGYGGSLRTPLRTGGFYGQFDRRGRAELKYVDVDLVATATSAAGTVTLLNGVAQGSDVSQRIGRKFMIKSSQIRLAVYPNSATTNQVGDIVRVMILFDCQPNSVIAAVGDVLEIATWESPLNLNNRDRFKVIMDKTITMNPVVYTAAALTAGAPVVKAMKRYKKLNLEVINSGTGATVGSIQTGALILLTIGLVNNGSTINWYHRTRYTDN